MREEPLTAPDGVRLYQVRHDSEVSRGVVVLVHGFCEHIGRYRHVIDSLLARGFSVVAYDQRGHGRSEGLPGHIERFAQYESDLELMISRERARGPYSRIFIVAHSMGGLVTLRYLAKHSDVEGAVISAPLLGFAVRAPALKMLFARVATRLAPRLRFPNEINPAVLSRDPDIGKAYAADPLVCKRVSLRWFSEASKAIEDFSGMAPGVRTPVLIMHGAEDRLASFEATKEIFEKIGSSDKEFQAYPGFYHELFNEPEKEQVLARACGWLEAHA